MQIDTLVRHGNRYLRAMMALAGSRRLRHADDEATSFVIDERTERINLTEILSTTDSLRGHRVLGALSPELSVQVRMAAVPTFDGRTDHDGLWSTDEFVRRFTGIRCYRVVVLTARHEPADIFSSKPRLTSGRRWKVIAEAAGLVSSDPAGLEHSSGDEAIGKHVLSHHPSWELASKAETITHMGPLEGLPDDLRLMAGELDSERIEAVSERLDAFERFMAERARVLTFRVDEVSPAELAQL
jgi:hypothetical protein